MPYPFFPLSTVEPYAFSDDFNRADSDTVGNGWIEQTGDWDIVSNTVRRVSGTGVGILFRPVEETFSDGFVQVEIRSAVNNIGVARYDSVENGYLLSWGSVNTLQLFEVTTDTFTEIDNFVGPPFRAVGDILRLEISGSTVRGLLNGVERVSATDSTHASGRAALRAPASVNTDFDNFSAGE